ncbi:hypothetical protein Sjap_007102 [Stephania japonica]|uniref:Uncharacterized protein n=1 Tax=Stephania japonica TaxID=461633 RepID=A0AAP0P9Q1_9MAGN
MTDMVRSPTVPHVIASMKVPPRRVVSSEKAAVPGKLSSPEVFSLLPSLVSSQSHPLLSVFSLLSLHRLSSRLSTPPTSLVQRWFESRWGVNGRRSRVISRSAARARTLYLVISSKDLSDGPVAMAWTNANRNDEPREFENPENVLWLRHREACHGHLKATTPPAASKLTPSKTPPGSSLHSVLDVVTTANPLPWSVRRSAHRHNLDGGGAVTGVRSEVFHGVHRSSDDPGVPPSQCSEGSFVV